MWMQTVNRTDTERVWLNVTNNSGTTISAHHGVFKYGSNANASSVSTNEGAAVLTATGTATGVGGLIGLAYEDIANGEESGVVQVYGYHESVLVMRVVGSVTVIPGNPIGPGRGDQANSVGFSSTGATQGLLGPIVALDTITATLHSLGTVGENYSNHVFLRCL